MQLTGYSPIRNPYITPRFKAQGSASIDASNSYPTEELLLFIGDSISDVFGQRAELNDKPISFLKAAQILKHKWGEFAQAVAQVGITFAEDNITIDDLELLRTLKTLEWIHINDASEDNDYEYQVKLTEKGLKRYLLASKKGYLFPTETRTSSN